MVITTEETRRKAATRAFISYFVLAFSVVVIVGGFVVYAVYDARHQARTSQAIRVEYCRELEKLKTQNREDIAQEKRDFKRNLRLLNLKETPALRRAAQEKWDRETKRNAPKSCPYTGTP
jgi:hypothetical protein